MAKCDLSIELDGNPNEVRPGGGMISGVVRVEADKDVKCNGLEVESGWSTHGRGNVASGTFATEVLFTGQWVAGETAEYRFELPIGQWPPSYHGHYLNVDHAINVRAKIPWGFDPKASASFLMRPSCGPEGAELSEKPPTSALGGCIGSGIVGIMLFVAAVMLIVNPFFLVFALLIVVGGSVYGFVKWFLPKFLLGTVECELSTTTVVPGEHVGGELFIRPRRNVAINAVTLTFTAEEESISGSGSNRTTHRKEFFSETNVLQDAGTLSAGQEHRFPIAVEIPTDAPYSLELSDNKLQWKALLRVDIPRWPDWTKDITIRVVPSGEPLVHPSVAVSSATGVSSLSTSEGITFAEMARHLWASQRNDDQVDILVEAVTGLTFNLDAYVERRLLYSGDEDPHVYDGGYAVWATYPDPELPMVLYVPRELGDEFEQVGRSLWQGRGTVVGWGHQHRRLQVKIEAGA